MDGPTDLPKDHKPHQKSLAEDGLIQSAHNGISAIGTRQVDSKAFRGALMKLDLFLLPTVTFIYVSLFAHACCGRKTIVMDGKKEVRPAV